MTDHAKTPDSTLESHASTSTLPPTSEPTKTNENATERVETENIVPTEKIYDSHGTKESQMAITASATVENVSHPEHASSSTVPAPNVHAADSAVNDVPHDVPSNTGPSTKASQDNVAGYDSMAGIEALQAPSVTSMELAVDSTDDGDSAIGNVSFMSSTASLRSSMYDYVEENGRRFHRFKEGDYNLPNDETEQDRLDLQHHLMLLTLDGKLHLAPVEDLPMGLHNVLDIATGTGIWAIEFAIAFPSASVLGTDLSPIQPEFVPANCRFEVDDVEDDWVYSYPFDYIHGRALALCFRSHRTVFQNAFHALRPGGYFEIQDVALPMIALDDTANGTALELWIKRLVDGGRALGKDFSRVPQYKKIMEEIGFVDVVERHFQWPLGTWAKGKKMKTLGAWTAEDLLAGLQGGSMGIMVKGLKMSVEEVELFLVDVRKDVRSNKIHSYFPVHVVYGRKP